MKKMLLQSAEPIERADMPDGCGPLTPPLSSSVKPLRQQVFEAIRAAGSIARVDVARSVGISPGSVTSITAELLEAGLIEETGPPQRDGDAGRGRPPVALSVRPRARFVAGIKLSSPSHSAVIVDFAGNRIGEASAPRAHARHATADVLSETIGMLDAALEAAGLARSDLAAVGLGVPGFVDSAWWARRHQADEIERMRKAASDRAILRRYSPPDEIAEAMMLFATQAALAIENARLLIDALEKERLHKELQVASEIQKKLIPDTLPVIKNLDISAVYLPSKEVSGDYYDVIQIDERRYAFVVADVAGKGIPGALLVSNMQASLYAYLEENPDLIHVVSRLNRRLINTTTSDRYITFFIGIYDMQAGDFTYVNAGHNPPILFKKDSVELLSTGGIFIGSMPWQYQKATIELKQGELLLLYTDGLVEAMDEKEEEFGEERLKQIVQDARDKSSADIESAIRRAVKKHTGGKQLDDDFTLIVIKRN